MENKPIQTDTEYEAVLREIERLFDAEPGTTQAEQLESLVKLVETYEDEHYSIPKPSLMARLLYKLESRRFLPAWIRK
jgi:HTH-type transcriptional regulator/antitoxin HigA